MGMNEAFKSDILHTGSLSSSKPTGEINTNTLCYSLYTKCFSNSKESEDLYLKEQGNEIHMKLLENQSCLRI